MRSSSPDYKHSWAEIRLQVIDPNILLSNGAHAFETMEYSNYKTKLNISKQ